MKSSSSHGVLAVLSSLLAASVLVGCGGQAAPRSGAPPTVFCGQTISSSVAGATVTDATHPGALTVNSETVGGVVLRVSAGCNQGATVSIEPPDAIQQGPEAKTKDGKLAAVVLKPVSATFDVTVLHSDGTTIVVHVRLTPVGPWPFAPGAAQRGG